MIMSDTIEQVINSLVEGNNVELTYNGLEYKGVFKTITDGEDGDMIIIKAPDSPLTMGFEIADISDLKIIPIISDICTVTFRNTMGDELICKFRNSEEDDSIVVNITGTPENLKLHNGLHARLMSVLIEALNE